MNSGGKGIFILLGFGICKYFADKLNKEKDYTIEKKNLYIQILDRLLVVRERGISLNKYLQEKNHKKVAIYGLGMIGSHLYEALKGTEVELIGIDKSKVYNNFRMPIYKPDYNLNDIDLIIVTPFDYKEIFHDLQKYHKKIISIHQLLNECEKYLYTCSN